jgi:hypothetical protein
MNDRTEAKPMVPKTKTALIEALETKQASPKGRPCPACLRNTDMHLGEEIACIALADETGAFGPPLLKCAMVQCGHCGFIALFNATTLGVEL